MLRVAWAAVVPFVAYLAPQSLQGASSWLDGLKAEDPATRSEAKMWLAKGGIDSLEVIELEMASLSPEERLQAKGVVSIVLLESVQPSQVERFSELSRLAQDEIARGFELARLFAAAKVLDIGEPPLLPHEKEVPPTEVESTFAGLRSLGGFAVPAALDLCKSDNPVARAYGAMVIGRLGATSSYPAVRELIGDDTPIGERGSDWVGSTTVGAVARRTLGQSRKDDDHSVALEVERYLRRVLVQEADYASADHSDLIMGIRQSSNAFEAQTWADWWVEARPAWEAWWRLLDQTGGRYDRQSWLNWLNSLEGFTRNVEPSADGRTLLKVLAPTGASCEVYSYDARSRQVGDLIGQGTIPVTWEVAPGASLKVVVALSSGHHWEKKAMYVKEGETVSIEVDPSFEPR